MTEHNKRSWTSKEKATAYEMRNRGNTYSAIAEALGRTVHSIKYIFNYDKKNGTVPRVGHYSRWTEEEKETAYELWKKGHSCREIGVCIGRSGDSVGHILLLRENKELPEQCCYYWTEDEIAKAERMREEGTPPMEIAGKIDEGITERRKRPKRETVNDFHRRGTICWTCKNAIVNCKKPVEGFTAEKKPYFVQRGTLAEGRKEFLGYSYLVKECPNYEPEPYAEEGKKWI